MSQQSRKRAGVHGCDELASPTVADEPLENAMKSALKITFCVLAACGLCTPAGAQTPRPWLVPDLLSAAKSEGGTLVMYASMNEEEALPYWAVFEQATGLKV